MNSQDQAYYKNAGLAVPGAAPVSVKTPQLPLTANDYDVSGQIKMPSQIPMPQVASPKVPQGPVVPKVNNPKPPITLAPTARPSRSSIVRPQRPSGPSRFT